MNIIHKPTRSLEMMNSRIVFSPMYSKTTYMIDSSGAVQHSWSSNYFPGEAIRWVGDGIILRTIKTDTPGYGGAGGGLQKILWDGTVAWDFRYNTNGNLSHHDILPLPNGNVLLLTWESKTRAEAIAAGRDPNSFLGETFTPEHIIEVKPTGPSSGVIVWEWRVWDHLIQDFNSAQENYGIIGDHPELIDINFGIYSSLSDWLHVNSIDYNEKFDQILISVHNFNEIWVIDHSTSTQEAAGHTGGNSGKGGDLLYRWGNPSAYHAGTPDDQHFFGQHDATWIEPGCPGEGNILVFNNGWLRPAGRYSSVDELIPPVNESGGYALEPGLPYGPEELLWSYTSNPLTSFYASGISGAQRLQSGNTLICDGVAGRFFEVTPEKETIWEYVNPYPTPGINDVFKIVYLPPQEPIGPDLHCLGSLSWTDVKPGQTMNGSFQVQNIGVSNSRLNWTVNSSAITWGTWSFTPASGEGLTPENGPLMIQVSVVAPQKKGTSFEGLLRVENTDNPEDFEVISVSLKTSLTAPYEIRGPLIHQLFSTFLHWLLEGHYLFCMMKNSYP